MGQHRLDIDELPDAVLVVGLDGCVEAVNRTFLELVGKSADDVCGGPFEALVSEGDMIGLVGFQAAFSEHRTQDNNVSFCTADGNRRTLLVSSVHASDGRYVILTARPSGTMQEELADASRWAAAEQERSLELARASDALATKNAALSAAQAEIEAAYAKLKEEGVTRERLETELRVAQRLEAIGQLAAGVAHEINTPMQYIGDNVHFLTSAFRNISSYLEVASAALAEDAADRWPEARGQLLAAQKKLKQKFLSEEIPKALAASKEGIEHVSKIVQAMKSFAHLDQDEKIGADINRTLEDTITVAQNEYKNVAVVQMDFGELPPVSCFPGKLNQVFLNLIVNAAHAIEDAKKEDRGSITVSTRSLGGVVEVRISDDGCGIPERIRDRIFDQFFTTKQVGRGTGQGLSLARSIVVDAHGGTLTFETEVGVGTTFIVRLPVEAEPGSGVG